MEDEDDAATAEYSEITALLRRNEAVERNARDVEEDMKRLLLLSRDHQQREEMIRAQGVRRITLIAKASSSLATHRYCTGILCNLAHSERGRLSGSSCDRWNCLSHRHNCPLFMLLERAQCSPDADLQHLSAAALLTFSIQSECQVHLDYIGGLAVLLRLLDARDADLAIYAACALWNLIKSPLLLLKLETLHGILRESLERRLTDLLWTPLEAFHLAVRPTGERGLTGILECDGDNLGIMLAAAVSTQLAIVLHVENYAGRPRALFDQFRGDRDASALRRRRGLGEAPEGQSVAHFDEGGVLVARSCAVCGRKIKLHKRSSRGTWVTCARDGCDQTYHLACSRWRALEPRLQQQHLGLFTCGVCVLRSPVVHYCDFLAAHAGNTRLVTETRFPTLGIQRVPASSATPDDAGEAPALAALLNRARDVVAVGIKHFRIPPSSQDLEMFIVEIRYVLVEAAPSTQTRHGPRAISASTNASTASSTASSSSSSTWAVSYAREDPTTMVTALEPGNVVFWPGPFAQDLTATGYTTRSRDELERAFVYEFQGETPQDRAYSFGDAPCAAAVDDTTAIILGDGASTTRGLWSTLHPRRGICMKLLSEQIGHHKQLRELLGASSSGAASTAQTHRKPAPKGHGPTRRRLHKVTPS